MKRPFAPALLAVALCVAARSAPAQEVDVALVLAVDVSLSMDQDEQRAQRDGYVEAVRHPAVLDAISRGARGRIAIAYVEWGGPSTQRIVAPWSVIDGPDAAEAFAEALSAAPLMTSRGTSISGALEFAADYLDAAPPAARRVIDVSGDGPNNMGPRVTEARDRVVARGVEINGLPLMLKAWDRIFSIPDLDIYYEVCVVGGPAPFVIPVLDPARFASAIRQKLVLEIAGATPAIAPSDAADATPARERIDCAIGEKLYERWRRSMDWN
jgi:hypothetical protein